MGGKSSTSTQQVSIPPQVLAQYSAVNARANQTAQTPFQSYGGQFVAPVNAQQNTGINATNRYGQEAQQYFRSANDILSAGQNATNPVNAAAVQGTEANSSPITGSQIDQYLSPYLNTVLGSTANVLNQNNQQQQQGALGNAISQGAFGGDRVGIGAANLEEQQNLANSQIYSGIANQGYQSALGTAQQEQQIGLAGAQQLAGIGQTAYGEAANTAQERGALGSGAQSAALQGAQAQIGAGTLQQQTQQAQDTALYNQFLQRQSYPFQVDQFLANIAEGTGALSGSTTTTTQPGGFFSDRRLKHDIKKIGKTYDNQSIYSYKMHGDPRTHVGLIAQDVEKKKPEAVGLASGYKTVDYDKATEGAAERGHFATGGGPYSAVAGQDSTSLNIPLASGRSMFAKGGTGVAAMAPAPAAAPNPFGLPADAIAAPSGGNPFGLPAGAIAAPSGVSPYGLPAPRAQFDVGGYAANDYDLGAILGQQQGMYQRMQPSNYRSIPSQGGQQHQLAVASGNPVSHPTGLQNTQALAGLAKDAEKIYNAWPASSPSTGGSGLGSYSALNSDYFNTPPAASGATDFSALGNVVPQVAAGGRIGYDSGGDPYSGVAGPYNAGNLNIPDESPHLQLPQTPALSKSSQGSGLQDLASIASIAAMFAKDGGRIHKDDGGPLSADPNQDPDMINPQAVGKGMIDRSGSNLVYARDPGAQVPTVEPAAPQHSWDYPNFGTTGGGWEDTPAAAPRAMMAMKRVPSGVAASAPTTPAAPAPAPTVTPAPGPDVQAAPAQAPASGVAAGDLSPVGVDPSSAQKLPEKKGVLASIGDWWDRNKTNAIPAIQGLAAMGMYPTKHLGVALAAGLGAGAQAYYPTQEAEQTVRQQQIQNAMGNLGLAATKKALNAPIPGGTSGPTNNLGPPPTDPGPVGAALRAQYYDRKNFVPPILPQEAAAKQAGQVSGGFLRNPGLAQQMDTAINARYQSAVANNQLESRTTRDAMYQVGVAPGGNFAALRSVDPGAAASIAQRMGFDPTSGTLPPSADAAAKEYATSTVDALARHTGDKFEDIAGREVVSGTGQAPIGQAQQTLTPRELWEQFKDTYASTETGAPARASFLQFARQHGANIPSNWQPPGGWGAPNAAAPAPGTAPAPGGAAAAQRRGGEGSEAPGSPGAPAKGSQFDFSNAPAKPWWLDDNTVASTTDMTNQAIDYNKARTALNDEYNHLGETQSEIAKIKRSLSLLDNTNTGWGTQTLSTLGTAIANMTGPQVAAFFERWSKVNPSAYEMLKTQMGTGALENMIEDLKDRGAQIRLGSQESGLILNKLSASAEMPHDAIRGLLGWGLQRAEYDQMRETGIRHYLDQGRDAQKFNGYFAETKPLESFVTTGAPPGTTLPPGIKPPTGAPPGAQAPGAPAQTTKVIGGVTYTKHGEKWYAH